MNYPSLNPNRQVIFDPCVTTGAKLLNEVGNAASELLGLAHGNPRGDGIKLIRTPMGEAYQMLEKVQARFDLIVSAPPAGTIPAKGLPKPTAGKAPLSAAPTGRKLIMSAPKADGAPVPEIDLGLATFLVTNALLSPFGEAMLRVSPESHDLIKKETGYARVWTVHTYAEWVELYLARDHRPLPGQPPSGGMSLRTLIRGTTFTQFSLTKDTYQKFLTVREEVQRKANETFDDFNIRLDNEKIRVRFSEFAILSGQIPQDLVDTAETLKNKTLLDLAVMRDTRDTARKVLTDKRLKVPPGLVAQFDDVCKQLTIQAAPFNRPSPVQRVAWLDEQNTIECLHDFGPFKAGQKYPIETRVITGKKLEKRHRPGYGQEEVLVSGQELVVAVEDKATREYHTFTQFEPSVETKDSIVEHFYVSGYHLLQDLITNFKMPEVQDIAEADPAGYIKYRKRLEALQT